jgi:hypothetical protein
MTTYRLVSILLLALGYCEELMLTEWHAVRGEIRLVVRHCGRASSALRPERLPDPRLSLAFSFALALLQQALSFECVLSSAAF